MLSQQVPIGCAHCGCRQVTIESIHMLLPEAPDGPASFGISALTGQVVGSALSEKQEDHITGRHIVIKMRCANNHDFQLMMHSRNGETLYRESAEELIAATKPPMVAIDLTGENALAAFIGKFKKSMMGAIPEAETEILWKVIVNSTKEVSPLLTQWIEVGKPEFTWHANGSRLLIVNYEKQHKKIAQALRLEKESLVKIVRDAMHDQTIALEIKVA